MDPQFLKGGIKFEVIPDGLDLGEGGGSYKLKLEQNCKVIFTDY